MRFAVLVALLLACRADDPPPRPALRLTYAVATDDPAEVAQVARIAQRRLDRLDVRGRARPDGALVAVELPALDEDLLARAKEALRSTGYLAFYLVDAGAPHLRELEAWIRADPHGAAALAVSRDAWTVATGETVTDIYVTGASPQVIERALEDAGRAAPADRRLLFEQLGPDRWRTQYVVRTPALEGDRVRAARARTERGRSIVEVQLDADGTRVFADLTAAHVGDKIAIALDGRVLASPVVNEPITRGQLWIEHDGELADLAILLDTGAYPAPVTERSVERLR